MRLAKVTVLLTGLLLALPTQLPDGTPVSKNDPGLGVEVIACGSCRYQIGFEDLLGGGDGDFNDMFFEIEVGDVPDKILSMKVLYTQTAFTGTVVLPSIVIPNKPIPIGLRVKTVKASWVNQPDELVFYTGNGMNNVDGRVHAVVYKR